jgi:type III secretion system YscQ/HrcQ family protein
VSELAAKKRVRPYPFADLPRLAHAQVEAGRVLLAHLPLAPGADWADACRALGGPVEIVLGDAYAVAARELEAQSHGTRVRLVGPGGRHALLVLDPRLAPRLARRALGTESDAELAAPRPLTLAESGAIEFLVSALLDAGPLRPDGVIAAEDPLEPFTIGPDASLLALEARLRTPVGDGWARVLAPESMRLHVPSAPRGPWRGERLAGARVALRLELQRATLTRDELGKLTPGDVVLLDHLDVRDPRGGPVLLRLGRGVFRGRLDGDALQIEEPFTLNLGAPHMDTRDEKPSDAASALLLGELPVEVVCELGRVTMSGRELLELRPGAVIPVGRPLSGPCDLTVGGRVVARGELVDVEGELGVRVTQMCD